MAVIPQLLKSEKMQAVQRAAQNEESFLVEGLWDAPKAALSALLREATRKNLFIISGRAKEENLLFYDLRMFCGNVVDDLPAWETLPSESIPPSPDIVGERYHILWNLLHATTPRVVITSVQASLQRLIPPARLQALCLTMKIGMENPFLGR